MAKIKYIGRKSNKEDNVAGTGLSWRPGEILEVKDALAVEKLLAHKDVWIVVADSAVASVPTVDAKKPAAPKGIYEDEEVEFPPVIDFNRLGKDKIDDYCRVHLSLKIDQRKPLPAIRQQAWAAYGKHVAGLKGSAK